MCISKRSCQNTRSKSERQACVKSSQENGKMCEIIPKFVYSCLSPEFLSLHHITKAELLCFRPLGRQSEGQIMQNNKALKNRHVQELVLPATRMKRHCLITTSLRKQRFQKRLISQMKSEWRRIWGVRTALFWRKRIEG